MGELGAHWPGGSFFFFGRLFHLDEVRDTKLKLKERIRRRILEVKQIVDGVASIAQPITRTNLKAEVKSFCWRRTSSQSSGEGERRGGNQGEFKDMPKIKNDTDAASVMCVDLVKEGCAIQNKVQCCSLYNFSLGDAEFTKVSQKR